MFSITHIAIVFLIALLVFGPEKLPEVARMLGKVLSDFRRASTDFRRVIEDEFSEIERQAREKQERERQKALTAGAGEASPAPTAEAAGAETDGGAAPPLEGTVPRSDALTSAATLASSSTPVPAVGDAHLPAAPADGRPS